MTKKKEFVEPELIKYEGKLDEVTVMPTGTSGGGMTQIDAPTL